MAVIHYENDAVLEPVRDRKVAIIGYGSQGHAHALNLRDSGVDVRVGLHTTSASRSKAHAAGLRVLSVAEAAREANLIKILAPVQTTKQIYAAEHAKTITRDKAHLYAHGLTAPY